MTGEGRADPAGKSGRNALAECPATVFGRLAGYGEINSTYWSIAFAANFVIQTQLGGNYLRRVRQRAWDEGREALWARSLRGPDRGIRRHPRRPRVWDRPLRGAKMMKFTAPAGYLRAKSLARQKLVRFTPALDRILFDDKSPPVLKPGSCHREDGESSSGHRIRCVYRHRTVGAVAVSRYRRQPMMECIIFGEF